jgi:tetratricopeptide (TPR) repeat protein
MMGERFIYFTFAGMLPLLAAAAEQTVKRINMTIVASCVMVLALAWMAVDISRTAVWRDNKSFFTLAVQQTPTSMAVQLRMVQAELASQDAAAALRRIDDVLRERSHRPLDSVAVDFHFWRGKALLALNRAAEAYHEFKIYTDFHHEVSRDLALLLAEAAARSGNVQTALSLLKEESVRSADDDSVWNGLGNVYLMMKNFTSAADCYRNALRINPGNNEAAANLQVALQALRRK